MNVYQVKIDGVYQKQEEGCSAADIYKEHTRVAAAKKTLNVIATSVPNAIEVAEQYLLKGHDPITSVTLVCGDVKTGRKPEIRTFTIPPNAGSEMTVHDYRTEYHVPDHVGNTVVVKPGMVIKTNPAPEK